jgi:hypothetical protein
MAFMLRSSSLRREASSLTEKASRTSLVSGTAFVAGVAVGRSGATSDKLSVGAAFAGTGFLLNVLGFPGQAVGDGFVGAGAAVLGAGLARKLWPEPSSPVMPLPPGSGKTAKK